MHNVIRVDLYEKNHIGHDLNINEELITLCYADKAEESLVSKVRLSHCSVQTRLRSR